MMRHTISAGATDLVRDVVRGGVCIGCGACAAFDPGLRVRFTRGGVYEAQRWTAKTSRLYAEQALRVCPFSGVGDDEDEIAVERFGRSRRHAVLGRYRSISAGYALEGSYRFAGSSGGLTSWFLCELLRRGMIDGVVHVGPSGSSPPGGPLFEYRVSLDEGEIASGARSHYYPASIAGVLEQLRSLDGRYAFTGLPCFVKAIRGAIREDERLRSRIPYTIGIVCGHLKSARWSELLAWQSGVDPGSLAGVRFREPPLPGTDAKAYRFAFARADGTSVTENVRTLVGSDWAHRMLACEACECCDDVVAETADVTFGDAWLGRYRADSRGTNLVIARNREIDRLLKRAAGEGRVHLEPLRARDAVRSQMGAFRDRREALAYRLALRKSQDRWFPRKRVGPSRLVFTPWRRRIERLRLRIRRVSAAAIARACEAGDLNVFLEAVGPLVSKHQRLEALSRRPVVRAYERFVAWVTGSLRT